ncbi:MAG: hypothetical protein JWR69_3851 [Pedosphaera sp.]|nr:hypothetical protein [Pedosphaera sp.]
MTFSAALNQKPVWKPALQPADPGVPQGRPVDKTHTLAKYANGEPNWITVGVGRARLRPMLFPATSAGVLRTSSPSPIRHSKFEPRNLPTFDLRTLPSPQPSTMPRPGVRPFHSTLSFRAMTAAQTQADWFGNTTIPLTDPFPTFESASKRSHAPPASPTTTCLAFRFLTPDGGAVPNSVA